MALQAEIVEKKIVLKKKQLFFRNILAIYFFFLYTRYCCGMIAMKREVAAKRKRWQVFRGANVKLGN